MHVVCRCVANVLISHSGVVAGEQGAVAIAHPLNFSLTSVGEFFFRQTKFAAQTLPSCGK